VLARPLSAIKAASLARRAMVSRLSLGTPGIVKPQPFANV
jgi:hypothetical protein